MPFTGRGGSSPPSDTWSLILRNRRRPLPRSGALVALMGAAAGYPTASSLGSGRISRAVLGEGFGRRGSRTPAEPPPDSIHKVTGEPGGTFAPDSGLWSVTTPSGQPRTERGGPSGSEPTPTSPASCNAWRASSQDWPITFGTTTEDRRRHARAWRSLTSAATTSRTVSRSTTASVALEPPASSRSRQRSQADWRVTPSWVAISAQDLPCLRAVRTATSSA